MENDVFLMLVAEIVELLAISGANRMKIFEHRDVITALVASIGRAMNFDVIFAVIMKHINNKILVRICGSQSILQANHGQRRTMQRTHEKAGNIRTFREIHQTSRNCRETLCGAIVRYF